jgi:hypothetical protein
VGGVVEDHGVFAHQVVDVARAAGQRDLVLGDRVEAEEDFLAVEDVELEQRRAGMGADLDVGVLDEAEAGEFLHGIQDGMGVAAGQPVGAGPVVRVVAEVVGPAGQHHGTAGVGQQQPDGQGGGFVLADADVVEGFLDGAVEGFAGESGEVDGYVLAGEGLLDERAQADRGRGEHWRPGCAGGEL